jgi:hypothetical protein
MSITIDLVSPVVASIAVVSVARSVASFIRRNTKERFLIQVTEKINRKEQPQNDEKSNTAYVNFNKSYNLKSGLIWWLYDFILVVEKLFDLIFNIGKKRTVAKIEFSKNENLSLEKKTERIKYEIQACAKQ